MASVEERLKLKQVPNNTSTGVAMSLSYSALSQNKLGVIQLVQEISEVRETASAGDTLYVYFEEGARPATCKASIVRVLGPLLRIV